MSDVHARRLAAQLLAGPPAPDAVAVCERLLAVQSQELRAGRLAVRARTRGLTAADVDAALSAGKLVVAWFNRGTLHLVRREDHPWLLALTAAPTLKRTATRLDQMGVTADQAERGVAVVERALADEGPLPREALRDRLTAAGIPTGGQVLPHLLGRACLLGIAVRGPMVDGRHAFALVRDWLGEPPPVDRDRALAELARRYLAGHGPADDRDLARWTGLPLRDARAGLGAIARELRERDDGLLQLATSESDAPPLPEPKLLGPWEPVLLGWVDRTPVTGPHADLITSNGIFHPFALVGGRAAGRWRMPAGRVQLEPYGDLGPADAAALAAEAADVERFLASSA